MQSWPARVALLAALGVLLAALAIGLRAGGAATARVGAGAAKVAPARARALLRGSPPALAALHRQAGRVLRPGGLARRMRGLRGHPDVLNVWASWCPPCREELPLLAAASARLGRHVAFLGADLEDDPVEARRLLSAASPHYPSYPAERGEIEALAPLRGVPVTLALDSQGELVREQLGPFASPAELSAVLKSPLESERRSVRSRTGTAVQSYSRSMPGRSSTVDQRERDAIGSRTWAIAEGYIPAESTGSGAALESHETACLLNVGEDPAAVRIRIFFADREPAGPYAFELAARRTLHLRFNELEDPEPIPRDTDYAAVIEADRPIVVQHTRLDSRQPALALLSTIAHPC
ncbi:MAG TPA: sensory rhodopsin transducer [Solirubrobacterales bacterium]|nr:sensory rhodopsin transducer [Solirubrobacterales bacterium]